jgi:toxin-antitoxin system PIN domain toxin
MRLPDVNVLLFAVNSAAGQHKRAGKALESAFADVAGVGLTWTALLGFIRLATRRGIFANPLSVEDALSVVRVWLEQPKAQVLEPTDRHHAILARLLLGAGTAGNLTTDAHLAALAIEHGATVLTFDRDFERFAGLRYQLLD